MPSNELPQRNPFVGPPIALAVDVPAEIVERYLNALHEWQPEQTHTDQLDQDT